MSHKPSKAYYVEGVHRFWIDEGYVVCRIECSDYYARQAQNFCGGCKEMDFLLYHPERRDLWLVEVKDYRFDARPKVGELVCALSRKVRDTMFLLRAASVAAPDEEPAEGISLRDFSIQASGAADHPAGNAHHVSRALPSPMETWKFASGSTMPLQPARLFRMRLFTTAKTA